MKKTFFSGRSVAKRWCAFMSILGAVLAVSTVLAAPHVFHIQIEGLSPYYFPETAEVRVGTRITWTNPTATYHTITHDGCKAGGLCAFDSDAISPNATFEISHLPPGRYPYHCTLHPIMRGTLIVKQLSDSSLT